jgi:hypothetical protein
MLEHYLRIAVELPVLEIHFREGFKVLPSVLDELINVLEKPRARLPEEALVQ